MIEPFTAEAGQRDLDDLRRRFADRDHAAIASWHVLPGVSGHHSAHTHPDQLAADIRQFFRALRPARTNQEK